MVRLIIDRVDVNAKNSAGLTALDISQDLTQPNGPKLRLMLLRGGALRASSLPTIPKLADSLKSKMSWHEKWIISDYRKRLYLSNEERNIILLVAVLFATANYQSALDSFSKDENHAAIPFYKIAIHTLFNLVNNIAFLASMVEIYIHLPTDCRILRLVLPLVICNYALVNFTSGYLLLPFISLMMFLFYHSKLAIILHKFVPILVQKKVMEMKIAIFKHCSSFHKDLMA